jgi:hypothetical protein
MRALQVKHHELDFIPVVTTSAMLGPSRPAKPTFSENKNCWHLVMADALRSG